MKKIKNFFIKEMKKYDTSWMWILSVLALFGLFFLFWNLLVEGLKYEIVYFMTMIFTFFALLPIIALNFKNRALYDPRLNMVDIYTFEEINNSKYLNKVFNVSPDPTGNYYGMYLKYEASRPEDFLYIYFRPDEIDFFEWTNKMKEILNNQELKGVTFKQNPNNHANVVMKFWVLSSKEDSVVYAPGHMTIEV